ncbi:UDP-N-acetylglucosamine--N-acetylmuramyl- (pentapeptide) pyrophosphoryl-undecaprenol N-acetylglucosamine transferase [Desulfurella amilsii]|uniref:UDP-N-acetylglucosamine--N-acetylmuramyl-(pentapeptide) pyrophosphoryl-undecaprenol N-acetylglucosamine transferase n=1 Tax=Desulfurella amilsii TaxID=1562698 RepID=A0A1X4XUX4_9BACT|nr:undecaprenyldiphospho-muramoylpentapeptide beta-N-acetylglucosaminyltransferase [Desulfurella amilsii]OSS41331.1 UDP-N-acetylglucosamine--N-acetylmuramyl- (pentapeptide) pyrophosphoryl-undecaprenol N-acetylglucosamine transferase [Desulfurella amilsii]
MSNVVFVTGGGTGGHYFAAESFVNYLKNHGYEPIFIGSEFGIEKKLAHNLGIEYKLLKTKGFAGKNFLDKIRSIVYLFSASLKCLFYTLKYTPTFVIGFGGYTSIPVLLSAVLARKKRIIVEQNSIPGLANKILAKFCHIVFVNFDSTKQFFRKNHVYWVGNPIRTRKFPNERNFLNDFLRIGVVGGSRGAKTINNALFEFAQIIDDDLKSKIEIIHQTGIDDYKKALQIYQKYNIKAKIYDFIYDMENFYRNIDIIVSRAGSSTLSEIACYGLPSILVPYPYAIYNHQYANAQYFEKPNAAKLILDKDFNGYCLKNFVYYIKVDELVKMSNAAFGLCKKEVCNRMLNIIEKELVKDGKSN